MKCKSKVRFRIVSLGLIAMFLIIPLLSSPVAAAFTSFSSADTNCAPTGPTALATVPSSPGTFLDSTPRTATFQCSYSFRDTMNNGRTPSSDHWATITVQKTSTIPWGSPQTSSTGTISLNNGQTQTGTLVITDTWTLVQVPVTWHVVVHVYCKDRVSGVSAIDVKSYDVNVV